MGVEKRLSTGFLGFCIALTDLELRIAFANHVNSAATTDNLAIRVAVLERTDAAYNFHDSILTSAGLTADFFTW